MPTPIAPISGDLKPIAPIRPAGASERTEAGFFDTLKGMLGEVEQAQKSAEEAAQAYATGRSTDVTATMITVERASITLSLMLQIRSRLLEAYQEIQRMQV